MWTRAAALLGFLGPLGLALACSPKADPALPAVALNERAALLPARLRRLSNAEFANAAAALLEGPIALEDRLPPDVRQSGYTQNAEQVLSASLGTRIATLAFDLAEQAVAERGAQLLACPKADAACVERTIESLGKRAYRRPLSSAERAALLSIYDRGRDGAGRTSGLTWVLSALLQSPIFWYLEEGTSEARGSRYGADTVTLNGYEIASSLAFTVSGAPPDSALLEAAAAGQLEESSARASQARRLIGKRETRHHFRRFVLEWLEVDQLPRTAKDPQLFPTYDAVKEAMLRETSSFVDEVMVHEGASVHALLDAGFTSLDPVMARYYGFDVWGRRVSLAGKPRRGVLQHGSFLSAHAHEDSTSPIKRGDFVLRKVLCRPTPRPRELDIEVTIPPPDASHTTRERFAQHGEDPNCAFCHEKIDGIGYTFEAFDAAGRYRTEDNGKGIDDNTRFALDDRTLAFGDSVDLSRFLVNDPRTSECFTRHAFRFFSAQSDPAVEETFLDLWRRLPREQRESLIELVVAFVASDLFSVRRARDAR